MRRFCDGESVACFCEDGTSRACIAAACLLISVGYSASIVCDLIEATRFVADLSSKILGRPSARRRLIAFENVLQENMSYPCEVMPSMPVASRKKIKELLWEMYHDGRIGRPRGGAHRENSPSSVAAVAAATVSTAAASSSAAASARQAAEAVRPRGGDRDLRIRGGHAESASQAAEAVRPRGPERHLRIRGGDAETDRPYGGAGPTDEG